LDSICGEEIIPESELVEAETGSCLVSCEVNGALCAGNKTSVTIGETFVAKFMIAINEEDGTIAQMSKTLGVPKAEVVIIALNLLNFTLENRKEGRHLTYTKGEDKTKDILNEATEGTVAFNLKKVNQA
jgi:hypothetical protein